MNASLLIVFMSVIQGSLQFWNRQTLLGHTCVSIEKMIADSPVGRSSFSKLHDNCGVRDVPLRSHRWTWSKCGEIRPIRFAMVAVGATNVVEPLLPSPPSFYLETISGLLLLLIVISLLSTFFIVIKQNTFGDTIFRGCDRNKLIKLTDYRAVSALLVY